MAFQKFSRKMAPFAKAPFATIQRKGNIGLNASALALLLNPEAVELWFDEVDQRIGLTACDPAEENVYKVRPLSKAGTSYIISAAHFSTVNKIPSEIATRYTVEMDGEMLVIDVSVPGTAIGSNAHRDLDEDPLHRPMGAETGDQFSRPLTPRSDSEVSKDEGTLR